MRTRIAPVITRAMSRLLRSIVWTVLWCVAGLCLAAAIVPHFLDRIYYRGPATGHFDGQRFANPDGEADTRLPGGSAPVRMLWRQATGDDGRPAWPRHVAVTPVKPAARVTGEAMTVTWVGHASVLVQTDGLNILTDPVWSATAGPFGIGPARVAEPGIRFEDLPRIDLVLVSHDHYDHMDLATLRRLWARDRPLIVTSLGNDSVIRQAGATAAARDWGGRVAVRPGVDVIVTRNHHWGSRWFSDRNRALWSSFVVTLPGGNLFFAGDTGAGDLAWPGEAAAHGPVRFAMLPIGAFRFQPGQMAQGTHIGPLDAVRVWNRLGRPYALPIHWGTFRLSYEGYDTPPRMLALLLRCAGADPAWFAAKPLGVPFAVPPLRASPAIDEARLGRCAEMPAVRALP